MSTKFGNNEYLDWNKMFCYYVSVIALNVLVKSFGHVGTSLHFCGTCIPKLRCGVNVICTNMNDAFLVKQTKKLPKDIES